MNLRCLLSCVLLCAVLAACASASSAPEPGNDLRRRLERADTALREARLTDAEALYRELSVSHPDLPEVWLRLGNIYARQAQLPAAMRAYRDGLRYARDDGRLWYNLALVELKQSVQTLEASSEVLPADSPHRQRIQQLHDALLSISASGAQAP